MAPWQTPGSWSLSRVAAAGFALAFACSQFLSGLHLLLVEHETCEHGEIVHGGSRAAADLQVDEGLPVVTEVTPQTHEHCSAPLRHEERARVSTASVEAPVVQACALERAVASTSVLVAQQRLFRLAPKQSPPV